MIHAMGAIEMALMDIKGKAHDAPAWKLLGRPPRPDAIRPYASLQPELPEGQNGIAAYRESLVGWVATARKAGFSAAKAEVTLSGPFAHMGMNEADSCITDVVSACRDAAGPSSNFSL